MYQKCIRKCRHLSEKGTHFVNCDMRFSLTKNAAGRILHYSSMLALLLIPTSVISPSHQYSYN